CHSPDTRLLRLILAEPTLGVSGSLNKSDPPEQDAAPTPFAAEVPSSEATQDEAEREPDAPFESASRSAVPEEGLPEHTTELAEDEESNSPDDDSPITGEAVIEKVVAAVEALDPAIPGHLLKPWSGSDSHRSEAVRDAEAVKASLNAFDIEAEEPVTEPSEEEDAVSLEGEWAVATLEASDEPVAVEPAVELSSEWSVAAREPNPPLGEAAPVEPAAFEVEAAAPEPKDAAKPEPVATQAAPELETHEESVEAEIDTATVAEVPASRSHEARLASNRGRVRRLVAALQAEREQALLWQTAVEERDAALIEAHEQITAVSAVAEENQALQQRLADANERVVSLEAERDAAIEAAQAAAERAEGLEEQLAQAESQADLLAEMEAVELPAVESEPVEAVEAAEEAVAPVEVNKAAPQTDEETQVDASPWAAAVTDEEVEPLVASEPPTRAEAEVLLVVEDAPPADTGETACDAESLWGIEQLATDTNAAALAPASAPEPSVVEAADEADDAAPEEPAASAWRESTTDEPGDAPSDHLVAAAALEPTVADEEPVEAAEIEPSALAAEMISELGEAEAPPRDPFARPEADTPSEPHQPPASFIDQYAHLVPDDDEPVEAPTPIAEPEPVVAEAPANETDEEESIDDYMRKLMGRVRGEAPAATASSTKTSHATTTTTAPTVEAPTPKPAEPVKPIRDLSELKRGPKLEINTDMGALRQLANQSARHAIDVAATKQSREQATLRLTVSAVAIGCGALASITAISPFDLQFAGGLTGLLAGSWFGLKTLRACQAAARQDELAAVAAGESVG
ncbi:MAG: hypothetical protein AAF266_13185, partial [Planctomycetota bacterium]